MPLIGYSEMNKRILNLIKASPTEIEDSLLIEAKEILAIAVPRAPISESGSAGFPPGALRDSGMIEPTEFNGHDVLIPISFGKGLPDERAIYSHEDLSANHPRGGQAKYLESVILERENGMSTRIGNNIKLDRMIS